MVSHTRRYHSHHQKHAQENTAATALAGSPRSAVRSHEHTTDLYEVMRTQFRKIRRLESVNHATHIVPVKTLTAIMYIGGSRTTLNVNFSRESSPDNTPDAAVISVWMKYEK